MIRHRLGAVSALVATLLLAAHAPKAQAAADVHKLSLVLSGMPTSVDGGDFNKQIERYNQLQLNSHGLEGLKQISFAWEFDASLRYFVRSNVAMDVGVGQLRTQSKREFLPALLQDVTLRAELLSVPVHAGAIYYLAPFNQGDFQARAYLGGGFLSLVGNKALVEQVVSNGDSVTFATFGRSFKTAYVSDSPGYYMEVGGHMFFASRFSIVLGAVYRSAVIRNMLDRDTRQPVLTAEGKPFTLDVSGVGAKMALGIGF